jgi:hypothetical protein
MICLDRYDPAAAALLQAKTSTTTLIIKLLQELELNIWNQTSSIIMYPQNFFE